MDECPGATFWLAKQSSGLCTLSFRCFSVNYPLFLIAREFRDCSGAPIFFHSSYTGGMFGWIPPRNSCNLARHRKDNKKNSPLLFFRFLWLVLTSFLARVSPFWCPLSGMRRYHIILSAYLLNKNTGRAAPKIGIRYGLVQPEN